ncbi:hypothetical protein, partial [Salmonella enterica]|uniref:hypothetical protein n=1 Tax=Salmonella enterica TaxID=28901 RepID=UPI001960A1E8
FEWVHVQLHQQKGMISLSPPTICNSASENTLSSSILHAPSDNVLTGKNNILHDLCAHDF